MADETLLLLAKEVRAKTLRLLEDVDEGQARFAAPGLNNTILWNAGHVVIVNEHLGVSPATASRRSPASPALLARFRPRKTNASASRWRKNPRQLRAQIAETTWKRGPSNSRVPKTSTVASVATNGGRRTTVMSQAWKLPISRPTTSVPRIARAITQPAISRDSRTSSGANSAMSIAQTEPLKAITEPLDKSMPPEMITMADPSAKIPSMAVWRRMFTALSAGLYQ